MDISIWGARKSNDVVSACAYVTMGWHDEDSGNDVSERAYITYTYSRVSGVLKFSSFLLHDISLQTYEAMTNWANERMLQRALANMTDYVIKNRLDA